MVGILKKFRSKPLICLVFFISGPADEGSEQGGEVGQAAGEGEVAARDRRQGEGREAAGEQYFFDVHLFSDLRDKLHKYSFLVNVQIY